MAIPNRTVLAPMAGVTDRPFRILCKRMGCGMLVSEMISAKGLTYNNERTWELLESDPEEQPLVVQLFGSESMIMAKAAYALQHRGARCIDINMGCPVPKVVSSGEGSALMKRPELVAELVSAVVDAVTIPVTVKIRKGWDENSVNCVEIAKICEQYGAAALAVHARTRAQFYSGVADWSAIADVKRSVNIPVFGNGDIFSAVDAVRMCETTRCDAVMVGRGAMGNPWIFREIIHYAMTGKLLAAPDVDERVTMLLEQMRMLIQQKGEQRAIKEMRSHAAWYTKGLRNSARLREQFNKADSAARFKEIFQMFSYENDKL